MTTSQKITVSRDWLTFVGVLLAVGGLIWNASSMKSALENHLADSSAHMSQDEHDAIVNLSARLALLEPVELLLSIKSLEEKIESMDKRLQRIEKKVS